jgi:hypothetical protein
VTKPAQSLDFNITISQGFEAPISASEGPQTHALDRAATRIGYTHILLLLLLLLLNRHRFKFSAELFYAHAFPCFSFCLNVVLIMIVATTIIMIIMTVQNM